MPKQTSREDLEAYHASKYLDALAAWRASETLEPNPETQPGEWLAWDNETADTLRFLIKVSAEFADLVDSASRHSSNLEPIARGIVNGETPQKESETL